MCDAGASVGPAPPRQPKQVARGAHFAVSPQPSRRSDHPQPDSRKKPLVPVLPLFDKPAVVFNRKLPASELPQFLSPVLWVILHVRAFLRGNRPKNHAKLPKTPSRQPKKTDAPLGRSPGLPERHAPGHQRLRHSLPKRHTPAARPAARAKTPTALGAAAPPARNPPPRQSASQPRAPIIQPRNPGNEIPAPRRPARIKATAALQGAKRAPHARAKSRTTRRHTAPNPPPFCPEKNPPNPAQADPRPYHSSTATNKPINYSLCPATPNPIQPKAPFKTR